MLDPKQIEEWKREGPGLVSDPVSTWTETIAPLIAEVERLTADNAEVRRMFDVTRGRVCDRLGLDHGKAWSSVEEEVRRLRGEVGTQVAPDVFVPWKDVATKEHSLRTLEVDRLTRERDEALLSGALATAAGLRAEVERLRELVAATAFVTRVADRIVECRHCRKQSWLDALALAHVPESLAHHPECPAGFARPPGVNPSPSAAPTPSG